MLSELLKVQLNSNFQRTFLYYGANNVTLH